MSAPVSGPLAIGALDLAALLCSRVCHDLISPVGAAGSAGAQIDLGDAEKAARGLIEDGKTTLVWNLPRTLSAKNRVKLLLNMVLIAAGGIPRGGTLTVDPLPGEDAAAGFVVTASGLNAKLNQAAAELLAGTSAHAVDAHAIQPLYTGILARDCGLVISATGDGGVVTLTAR
jgi:histidine phosphotransferase ChpT